jgi:hypothetical protein
MANLFMLLKIGFSSSFTPFSRMKPWLMHVHAAVIVIQQPVYKARDQVASSLPLYYYHKRRGQLVGRDARPASPLVCGVIEHICSIGL